MSCDAYGNLEIMVRRSGGTSSRTRLGWMAASTLMSIVYVRGNPATRGDPTGLICGIGACIGTAIGIGTILRTMGVGVGVGIGASIPVTGQSNTDKKEMEIPKPGSEEGRPLGIGC